MGQSYVTAEDYQALFPGQPVPTETELNAASAHIDSLTFGRIPGLGGLDALTAFQRDAVKEAVCRQARFEREYGAGYAWSAASYSINGVSVKAGHGEGVRCYGGLPVPGEVSSLLDQTGLCCRALGGGS